jgi:asparagine synthase (glutamine-hydrolysing)
MPPRMSGIVGLLNFDGRPPLSSQLEAMGAADSQARGPVDIRMSAGFGIRHHGLVSKNELGLVVAFDGRLDNRAEFQGGPPTHLDAERLLSDAALVARVYERYGNRFASHLNGDFACAVFDSRQRQLMLACDVMGARSLFYCQRQGTLLFASTIKALLADPRVRPQPDDDSVTDLVLDGWADGHHTCFKEIYGVPPGYVLLARENHVTLQRLWSFDPSLQIRFRTFGEYSECFRSLFEQSVRRRLRGPGPVASMVSGGVDSSSIFCQAAMLTRREPAASPVQGFAWTFPPGTPADEQAFLDVLDGVSGGRITRIPVADVRTLPTAEATVSGLEEPGFAWDAQHTLLEHARMAGCSVILEGYFGDQMLFARRYLLDLFRHGRWTRVVRDLKTFRAWMTDVDAGVFERQFFNGLVRDAIPRWLFQMAKTRATRWRTRRYPRCYSRRLIRRLLERQLSRFEPRRRSASRHAWEFHGRASGGHSLAQVRQLTALGVMHGLDVSYPFRDRDLVAFLMAIPGDVVNHHGVPKGLLRHALTGILPDPIRNRRSKADFTGVSNRAVLQDLDLAAAVLTRDCEAARLGFVDGDQLVRLVAASKGGIQNADDAADGWQINRLVGLEVWLRHFITDSQPYCRDKSAT